MRENEVSRHIIASAIEVLRELGGPGLLEMAYEEALEAELSSRGFVVRRQVLFPIKFKGRILSRGLRIDMIVDGLVIVECKSTAAHHSVFAAQALTYLRLSQLRLALVINFSAIPFRTGIRRIVNQLPT